MKRLVWLIAVIGLLASACQAASEQLTEQIIEQQEGVSDVDIDTDSGEVSIETDEGTISIGGDIPADFPFPFPDGYTVGSSFISDQGGNVVAIYPYERFDELRTYTDQWTQSQGGEGQTSFNEITSAEGKEIRSANWFSDEMQLVLVDNCIDEGGEDATCLTVATS